MTRVLHFTRDFPPRRTGGISTAVGGMVRALAAAGCEQAVASFDDWRARARGPGGAMPTPTVQDGVPVLRLSTPAQLPALRAFANELVPEVAHVHHEMLWEAAIGTAPRTVYTVHVLQSEQNRLRGLTSETLSSTAQRRALAEADRVLAPSRTVAERLGGATDRLRVVGLGFDDTPRMRATAHTARDRGPLVFAGRFADINGFGELLAALPRVLERAPGTEAIIAGGLPLNKRAEARWHRQWRESADDDIRQRVALPGWLDPDGLADLYASAAAIVVPSWFETFGLTTLEAMAWGVPIACSAGDLIEHDVTGLRFAPRNANALTEAALALLEDRPRARALADNAAHTARSEWTWDRILPGLLAAYTDRLQ